MTRSPHSIRLDASTDSARRLMYEHGIRHLPVLKSGSLVGIVTERDLRLIEGIQGQGNTQLTVEEAMSAEVVAVPPTAELLDVVQQMEHTKIGSVVVMDDDLVVGIFTTIDALRILGELLRPDPTE
ncbi:MAG: CBS domain-containing protein [Myxococcales bacterium]|nr:CBS domain-containing protein [Myxococcales bacterium]